MASSRTTLGGRYYPSRRQAMCFALQTLMLLPLAAQTTWGGELEYVRCDGTYPKHLQGICLDKQHIFWSFTTRLVKTNYQGEVLAQIPVDDHHGDLCYLEGRLYVAVNLGKFNDPNGNADSWVYVYDADSLELLQRHETQEVFHGAGGIGTRENRFYVVGGLPAGVEENYVYEYDDQFRFVRQHVIPSGHTQLGIQTATYAADRWWFGCYGNPRVLLIADADFELLGRHEFDCSLGIVGLPNGRLLVARGECRRASGCSGEARVATPDPHAGLKLLAAEEAP